ncbi:hypothetical protein [Bdellovibrio sp. HCB337]|uniref:hypothetical protein n=1 Tax=Bdellovibrio sp. HCB337 TaxID=3394358 RepID=UPI0039A52C93
MRREYVILGLCLVMAGGFWVERLSLPSAVDKTMEPSVLAQPRRPTSYQTLTAADIKAKPLTTETAPIQKTLEESNVRASDSSETWHKVGEEHKPDLDFAYSWQEHTNYIYREAGVTATEITQLNDQSYEQADPEYEEMLRKAKQANQDAVVEALWEAHSVLRTQAREKYERSILGDERYEYLIREKELFYADYKKKSGRDVEVVGW